MGPLQNRRFRIDPNRMKIVTEDEPGYEEDASSPVPSPLKAASANNLFRQSHQAGLSRDLSRDHKQRAKEGAEFKAIFLVTVVGHTVPPSPPELSDDATSYFLVLSSVVSVTFCNIYILGKHLAMHV